MYRQNRQVSPIQTNPNPRAVNPYVPPYRQNTQTSGWRGILWRILYSIVAYLLFLPVFVEKWIRNRQRGGYWCGSGSGSGSRTWPSTYTYLYLSIVVCALMCRVFLLILFARMRRRAFLNQFRGQQMGGSGSGSPRVSFPPSSVRSSRSSRWSNPRTIRSSEIGSPIGSPIGSANSQTNSI